MSEQTNITKRDESRLQGSAEVAAISPLVDIYENEDEILLHADMPGVDKEDVAVNIDNGTLDIVGIRKLEKRGVPSREEFGSVEYRRRFSVPQSIDVGKVAAKLEHGVLKLHLPKSEAAKPRLIEVKAA